MLKVKNNSYVLTTCKYKKKFQKYIYKLIISYIKGLLK